MRKLTVAALVAGAALMAPADTFGVGAIHDHASGKDSFDRRGAVAPSATQRAAAARLGARVSWGRFGAPRSVYKHDGWLAEGLTGTPETAAREFLRRNAALFGDVSGLRLVNDARLVGSDAHVVLFRREVGGLRVAGGTLAVGLVDGRVGYASSSLGAGGALEGTRRLTGQEAWRAAARSAGVDAGAVSVRGARAGFGQLRVSGLEQLQQVREVAAATGDGYRRAFEANVVDNGRVPSAWTMLVDAETGAVLRRVDRLDSAADQPNWAYFTNNPPLSGSGTDRRIIGCFPSGTAPAAPCSFDQRRSEAATPAPWDVIEPVPTPSHTTSGNNADTALSAASPLTPGPDRGVRPTSPTREYRSPFTNVWQTSDCDPSNFTAGIVPATGPDTFAGTEANDVNAAVISLFSNHNNMHDWAYDLGFTEENFNMQVNNFGKGGADGDPELGDAQGGALAGGFPSYTGRDNANQITLQDGVPPITNMYLWQPVAGAFYPPCVDGDFDMSVIGHEYTHAISNRMVGGPDEGLTSNADGQARAMGESYSDLTAVEYLMEHGYAPSDDENPFAVGAYVTGSKQKGIRNYAMNDSPLNYSGVQGYDGSGNGSPHDDGEIWSAANYDIRQALVAKYGAGSAADQLACARGQRAADECPGNRRWMQIVFDAYLLMAPEVSMLDSRDAYLAADRMRFGGANQGELWTAFARRGFGENAASPDPTPDDDSVDFGGTDNPDPVPSFESPLRTDESAVTFAPVDENGQPLEGELFVGEYEANVTPVADTDGATPRGATVELLPGEYAFVARADGRGAQKFTRTISGGKLVDLTVTMPANRASGTNGATIAGEGVNREALIDDTEETNWAVVGRAPDVAGAQVTVRLGGGEQLVDRVQASALLRAADDTDEQEDPGGQNRFTALRQFELLTCSGTCAADGDFDSIYTSPADASPGGVPRPLAPDMILRGFDVPDTQATHVRLRVLANQCTGSPIYPVEQENDDLSASDCTVGSAATPRRDQDVRAAELQVFSRQAEVTATERPRPVDPGPGTGGTTPAPAAPAAPPAAPAACASTAGFRSVSARPRGRGLRIAFARRVAAPVNVDVFQQSRGRRVIDNLLVARFTRKTRGFTWNGRPRNAKRLTNGGYFVRFRMPQGAGRLDVRRITVSRRGGRFRPRPAFYGRNSCGLVTSYKLSSAVFGGLQRRRLGIAFRLSRAATVRVAVTRGGTRTVRSFRARRYAADRTHRLSVRPAGLRRGDYRVTLRAGSVRQTLVARRLP